MACPEPGRILDFLRTNGKASQRKCRLLVCTPARCLWSDLPHGRSRLAVEAAERFADGSGGRHALRVVAADARLAHEEARQAFVAACRATRGKYRRPSKEAAARADATSVAACSAADDPLGFWDWVYTEDHPPEFRIWPSTTSRFHWVCGRAR